MRKIKTGICIFALMACAVANAELNDDIKNHDDIVTFNGKLVAETCEVEESSKNIKVDLPTIAVQRLTENGQEAGSKTFNINVTNCPKGLSKVAAHFEAISNTGFNDQTGNLTNAVKEGYAKGVEVRLYNTDRSQIRVGETGNPSAVTPGTGTEAPGKATMVYMAGYYATAATTAGQVQAQVHYVLAYP